MTPISEVVCQILDQIDEAFSKRCFHFTGHEDFDVFLGGRDSCDVMVVMGKPKVGKTELLLSMAYLNIKSTEQSIWYVTGKDSLEELTLRLISMHTGWSVSKIIEADFFDDEWVQLTTAINEVQSWPIYFWDHRQFSLYKWRGEVVGGDNCPSMLIMDDLDHQQGIDDLLSFTDDLQETNNLSVIKVVFSLGNEADEAIKANILKTADSNRLLLAELNHDYIHEGTTCNISAMWQSGRQYKQLKLKWYSQA